MAHFNRFALLCALSSASVALPATAQTDALAGRGSNAVRVDVLPAPKRMKAEQGVRLRVQVRDADVEEALKAIALQGNLTLVISSGVSQRVDFSIFNSSPSVAIQVLCEAAHLRCELRNGIWFISRPIVGSSKRGEQPLVSTEFWDTDAATVFNFIAQAYSLKLRVEPNVQGKIAYINLSSKTPRQAIELVARVLNLDVRDENGTLVVSEKKTPDHPAPEDIEPEKNSFKLRLL